MGNDDNDVATIRLDAALPPGPVTVEFIEYEMGPLDGVQAYSVMSYPRLVTWLSHKDDDGRVQCVYRRTNRKTSTGRTVFGATSETEEPTE